MSTMFLKVEFLSTNFIIPGTQISGLAQNLSLLGSVIAKLILCIVL